MYLCYSNIFKMLSSQCWFRIHIVCIHSPHRPPSSWVISYLVFSELIWFWAFIGLRQQWRWWHGNDMLPGHVLCVRNLYSIFIRNDDSMLAAMRTLSIVILSNLFYSPKGISMNGRNLGIGIGEACEMKTENESICAIDAGACS